MRFLKKISDVIFNIEKLLSIILMILMLGSISAGVVFRYFFNSPISWSEELAIFTLVWVTFIGGSMGVKTGQAAALELVFEKLNLSMKKIVLVIGHAIITVFCAFIFYLSFTWISSDSVSMQIAPSLGITMFFPYLAIPAGILFMGIHSLNHLVQSFHYESEMEGE